MSSLSVDDLLVAPCWLLATAVLFAAAWRVGSFASPRDDGLSSLLHALLLCWASIVAASLALSALGLLYAWPLLLIVAAPAAIVRFAFTAPRVVMPHDAPHLAFSRHRPSGGLLTDAFFANPAFSRAISRPDRPWTAAWIAYASLLAAAVVAWGLLYFTIDWDSLAYHIPFVDQWLRARTIHNRHSSSWFHPGNNELLGLWCVGVFSGDFLINLTNLLPVAILALGTRELARALGGRPVAAHLAGFAVATPYVVTRQLLDSENDVGVASLLVASIAYGVRYVHRRRLGHLLLWSASFGLLPGVKYYAVGYAGIAALGVTLLALRWRGFRSAARLACAGLAGAAVLSGSWYLRNYCFTGSPFYPRGFAGSPDLLAEMFPHLSQTTLLGNQDSRRALILLLRAVWSALGPACCIAVLAIPISTTLLTFRGFRRARSCRCGQGLLALTTVASLAVFCRTPFVVEVIPGTFDMLEEGYLPARFLLCTAALAVVAFFVCVDHCTLALRSRRVGALLRYGLFWLLGGAVLAQLCGARHWRGGDDPLAVVLGGAAQFLLIAVIACASSNWGLRASRLWRACAVLAASLAISALGACWHAGFARFYDVFYTTRLFSQFEAAAPSGTTFCALMYRSYPFFGSRRQFRVFGPVAAPTFADLEGYLRLRHPDCVVTINHTIIGPHRYDRMELWLAERALRFHETYSDSRFTVYCPNSAAAGRARGGGERAKNSPTRRK